MIQLSFELFLSDTFKKKSNMTSIKLHAAWIFPFLSSLESTGRQCPQTCTELYFRYSDGLRCNRVEALIVFIVSAPPCVLVPASPPGIWLGLKRAQCETIGNSLGRVPALSGNLEISCLFLLFPHSTGDYVYLKKKTLPV